MVSSAYLALVYLLSILQIFFYFGPVERFTARRAASWLQPIRAQQQFLAVRCLHRLRAVSHSGWHVFTLYPGHFSCSPVISKTKNRPECWKHAFIEYNTHSQHFVSQFSSFYSSNSVTVVIRFWQTCTRHFESLSSAVSSLLLSRTTLSVPFFCSPDHQLEAGRVWDSTLLKLWVVFECFLRPLWGQQQDHGHRCLYEFVPSAPTRALSSKWPS